MGSAISAVRGSRVDSSSTRGARPQVLDDEISQTRIPSPQRLRYVSLRRRHTQQFLSQRTQLHNDNDGEIPDRPNEQEDHPLFAQSYTPTSEVSPERPLTWRHSTISRISSRLLPDSIVRGLTNENEDQVGRSIALSQELSSRGQLGVNHQEVTFASDRASLTLNPTRRAVSESRVYANGTSEPRSYSPDFNQPHVVDRDLLMSTRISAVTVPRRSGTRFSRMRNSLSVPFSNLFAQSHTRSSSDAGAQLPLPRSSRTLLAEDSDGLLSQTFRPDMHEEPEDSTPHELEAGEPETRNLLSSPRAQNGISTMRRIPHNFRSRSTRLIRRGEYPPLSQVLQLAAAAIAAQLSGTSTEGSSNNRLSTDDVFDGSIQNFVQTLQDAASAQASDNGDLNTHDGELPPVNFMRVFQFPNDENSTPLPASARQQFTNEFEATNAQGGSDRSVTLVLVGVRSMHNVPDNSASDGGNLGSSLDALLSLPFLPPANSFRNSTSGASFRRTDNRYRSQNRRHSMTNFNFPQQYESQRHLGVRQPSTRTGEGPSNSSQHSTMLMSDSPPGPNPPPSTPADIRSGNATPNRRPSSTSIAHATGLPDLNEDQDTSAPNLPAESAFNTARQRRRSDSEFARRPELSSGSSRRNGVVEPDRPPPGAGRSWLIYVVGTNVAPDHPAFTMPSLFTENPTYEDMQMLSALLGPAKPPVATQEDVELAGGLYRVTSRHGMLMAEAVNGANPRAISINTGDRCLICLSEYEELDTVRQIDSCSHMYHRECIDEWLTTGRNSCPMCRGQGVKEGTSSTSLDIGDGTNSDAA